MRESIAGYADAVLERAQRAGTLDPLAEDLGAVKRLVEGNGDLRYVLSDPGVPPHVRRSVLTDLLGDRIQPDALRLLTFAAENDRATEYIEDVSWVAARAAAARDALVSIDSGPLGRHAAGERLGGYASAWLEQVADSRALGEIEDEMFRFMRLVDGSSELRSALTDRDLPASVRRSLVHDLLASKATDATTAMAEYATVVGRPRDYLALLSDLVERVAGESNRRIAEVRSAVSLDQDQRNRLGAALQRVTGRTVDVRVAVDRSVLGGFVATIGDTVVDGSVRHRLDLLKERLLMPEPSVPGSTDRNLTSQSPTDDNEQNTTDPGESR